MPTREAIDQFNETLIQLGDEPRIRRERGESIETVEPPDPDAAPDLDSLLGEETEEPDEAAGEDTPFDDDFFSDFASSTEYEDETPEISIPPLDEPLDEPEDELGGPEPEDADTDEGFGDVDDLGDFGDFGDLGDLDDSASEPGEPGEPGEAAEPEEPEEWAAEPAPGDDTEDLLDEDLFADEEDAESFEAAGPDEEVEPDESGDEEEPAEAEDFGPAEDAFGDVALEPGSDDVFGDIDFDVDEEADGVGIPETDDEFSIDDEETPISAEDFTFDEDEGFSFDDESVPDVDAAEAGRAGDDELEIGADEEPDDDDAYEPPDEEAGEEESFELDEDEGDLDVDEFSLGDFGEEFGVLEEGPAEVDEEELNPAVGIPSEAPSPSAPAMGGEPNVRLSDEDFDRLKRTLGSMPLNVRMAVERIIAEGKGSASEQEKLVSMLVAGDSPKNIAVAAGRILGERLRIPKNYEKKSGISFEDERQSFAYRFREEILPVIRVALLGLAAIVALVLLVYNFVYRPIRAAGLYQQGLENVQIENYERGNRLFDEAVETWEMRGWYFTYADEFIRQDQLPLAREKFLDLLDSYPDDREGLLQLARMEWVHAKNYDGGDGIGSIAAPILRQADDGIGTFTRRIGDGVDVERLGAAEYLNRLISLRFRDFDARLQLGDMYMDWARNTDDAGERARLFEEARAGYARLIEMYGEQPQLLFRMLGYFLAVDNLPEILRLHEYFEANPDIEVEPDIYSRLGGRLLDAGMVEDANRVLIRSLQTDPQVPRTHYELARYFREIERPREERLAVDQAIQLLDRLVNRSPEEIRMRIDAYIRRGELEYDDGEYLAAEGTLQEATAYYQEAKALGYAEPSGEFGRAYALLGDIYYYHSGEDPAAIAQYRTAEAEGYDDREVDYKLGVLEYRSGDRNPEALDRAMSEFVEAAGAFSTNLNLLYATANTLYRRGMYGNAEGYYLELLDRLLRRRRSIPTLFVDEDPEHRNLIQFLIRVTNNLGVTRYRLSQRSGDENKLTEALVSLVESDEYFENLTRNPATFAASDTQGLAALNRRAILYPEPNLEPQIYLSLPLNFEARLP